MEFKFNLGDVFDGRDVVEIGNTLIPPGFSGDKRALWDTQSKVSQIVNAMGEASAAAQGLSKPITTSDRLRNSEHKLYLLIDESANNGKGAVTGMLKTGEKGLYVFDRDGRHYQVSPHCVLDFYVHESKQRSGLGKKLFEYMLQREHVEPVKMAIDRPSEKLLGFLHKHYDLTAPVKQMNNYVVFDGFFPKPSETGAGSPAPPDSANHLRPSRKESANGLQQHPASPYGRYAAPRPPCSMGQIIHNDSSVIKRGREATGVKSEPVTTARDPPDLSTPPPISRSAPAVRAGPSSPPDPEIPQNPTAQTVPYPYRWPVDPRHAQFALPPLYNQYFCQNPPFRGASSPEFHAPSPSAGMMYGNETPPPPQWWYPPAQSFPPGILYPHAPQFPYWPQTNPCSPQPDLRDPRSSSSEPLHSRELQKPASPRPADNRPITDAHIDPDESKEQCSVEGVEKTTSSSNEPPRIVGPCADADAQEDACCEAEVDMSQGYPPQTPQDPLPPQSIIVRS
ncbi:alpha-tubulin N-acetyltransferase 1-like isoform X1 [Cylas formicarius]|uniref:alpha-tubulin N-acetyltransferase 1-like isoform X1 n=1 Tax=Cylas formicarius TaxID=197179 RepID=UPI002958ABDC|nr:alpha-tubulin N-acetyltransferase 1-like isoform X1 [Cylas formicarius]